MTVRPRLAPTRGELREMLGLATPIVVVNLGMMLQGAVDTIMLGHASSTALAAGALGNLYFFNVIVVGMGMLMSLDPIVAQALGARDADGAARGVQRGVILAVLTAVLGAACMMPAGAVLKFLNQPADVIDGAAAYARWSALGIIPWQLFSAFRQTLQAMHRVLPMAVAVIIANLVNALLAWIFVFGKFGVPAMGVVGAAHATWISRWLMVVLIVWLSWKDLRPMLIPWRRESLALRPLWRMIVLGTPIGLQWFAEGFAFGFSGIAIGWLGAETLAGHQITLTMASLTFMVPMGVAGAGAAMVGRAIGAGDVPAARRAALAALTCGVGFMSAMAIFMIALPGELSRVFTREAVTIGIAAALVPIAGVFQVFDGTQVVASAILRGTGDTRVPMILHVLSFWAFGIPLGLVLAFTLKFGAPGMWWGLTAGLAAAAVLQLARVRMMLRRDITRVVVD
ncbi:MAG TPA: MATE family efflux transporter [Gemmatimonadaceae bacterium]|nr:MATE family efflux transporter [Gemmatimonadaceae bacterium]